MMELDALKALPEVSRSADDHARVGSTPSMSGSLPARSGAVAPDSAGAIPISHFVSMLRYRWKLWLALVALCTLAGLVAALLIPRRYEADAVLLPRGADRSQLLSSISDSLGGLAGIAGLAGLGNQNEQRAEAIQMLQSEVLAREFITDNNLIPVLFASDWDAKRGRWRGRAHTINDAVDVFDKKVRSVIEDRRTGLVTMRVAWKNPVIASSWANELVHRANDRLRSRAIVRAQGSIDYLKREARDAESVEIRQSLYRMMEQQYQNLLLANVSDDYAFYVIDPAVAPDNDQYVFPRRGLFTFAGAFFGLVLVLILMYSGAFQAPVRTSKDHTLR